MSKEISKKKHKTQEKLTKRNLPSDCFSCLWSVQEPPSIEMLFHRPPRRHHSHSWSGCASASAAKKHEKRQNANRNGFCEHRPKLPMQSLHVGVSKNRGKTPQIIQFNRVFHYKPSILGGLPPLFLETPMLCMEKKIGNETPVKLRVTVSGPTATAKSVHGQSLMQRRPRCPKPNAASIKAAVRDQEEKITVFDHHTISGIIDHLQKNNETNETIKPFPKKSKHVSWI